MGNACEEHKRSENREECEVTPMPSLRAFAPAIHETHITH
jgi:hypothetical protein